MDFANHKLGHDLGLFDLKTMVHQGLHLAPRMVALVLASCLALPSARADGWQGGGHRGHQAWGGGNTGGNQGGYWGGGNYGGYRGGNNNYGGRYNGANSYRGGGYQGGNYYGGAFHGGGYRWGGYRPAYGYGRPYGWNRGWQNGGYWGYRPWTTGWYNWAPSSWSWWGPSAVGWGVMGLATGAVITGLVNRAAQNQSTVIVVPDTTTRLDFASVLPAGDGVVSFRYIVGTTGPAYQANGDCRQGLFNGQAPRSVAEAQLLNTTCHVAYGNGTNRAAALANDRPGVPVVPNYGNGAPVAPSYGNGGP